MKVLITGATGNVGSEVIKALGRHRHSLKIYAGVRDLKEESNKFIGSDLKLTHFDFTNISTYAGALENCDILFLLRPPQISEVEKYFKPLIDICKSKDIKHIVFLSVQGVEKSSIIPHFKIEKLTRECGIDYTFLRPAYFMQNFTGTLSNDLINKKLIYLPSGNAKFTLVDVRDVGDVAANVLINTSEHKNKSYELTNNEKLNFQEMAKILTIELGKEIRYESPNLIQFFMRKRKENIPTMLILVMIMLHYLPRFQKEPEITDWVEKLAHKVPFTFEQFVKDHKELLVGKR